MTDEPPEDDLRRLLHGFADRYQPDRQRMANLLNEQRARRAVTGLSMARPVALGVLAVVGAVTMIVSVLGVPERRQAIVAVDNRLAASTTRSTGPSPGGPSTSESFGSTTTSVSNLSTAATRAASRLTSTTDPVDRMTETSTERTGGGTKSPRTTPATTTSSDSAFMTTSASSSSTTTTGETVPGSTAPESTVQPTTTTTRPTTSSTTTAGPTTSTTTITATTSTIATSSSTTTTTTTTTTSTIPSSPVDPPDSCYVHTEGIEVFDSAFEFAHSYDFHGQDGEFLLNTSSLGPPDEIRTVESSIEWTAHGYGYEHDLVYYVAAREADDSTSSLVYCRRHDLLD